MKIPGIRSICNCGVHEATFALSLYEIRPESLGNSVQASEHEQRIAAHRRCVSLMSLLARWSHPFSFELHIQSFPSLLPSFPGRTSIALLWHVRGDSAQGALELALADYVALLPMLEMCWPTCEWASMEEGELRRLYSAFDPRGGVNVCHRSEPVSISRPFFAEAQPIGFRTRPDARSDLQAGGLVEHAYPWVPNFGDELTNLLGAQLGLPSPRWIVIRAGKDGGSKRERNTQSRLEGTIEECERYLAGHSGGQLALTARASELRGAALARCAQLTDGALSGSVLLFSPGEPDYVTANLLGQSVTGDHARRNTERMLEGGFMLQSVDPRLALSPFSFPDEELWSAEEGSGAFRLPTFGLRGSLGLPVMRHRSVEFQPPTVQPSAHALKLGINRHRGISREIHIEPGERLHHTFCIGATGVGKSTFLLNCMLQDARDGVGFTLIDPPGELADDLLARFPRERVDDLIVVDFEDRDRPVPLNLLAWKEPDERDLIIDTFYTTLLSIYKSPDMFGPVFEQYFRSSLRLLMGDVPHSGEFIPTLLEFPLVLRDRNLRAFLKSLTDDEEVSGAATEAEKASGEYTLANVAPYVNSKFSRFLQDSTLRRIIGHGRMSLDFREVMDSGKVLIVKLAQGRFGRNAAEILMTQLVARLRMAAMSRGDIQATQRRPHYLYVDECQVLADANIAEMLSQCRKYSLGLILANQYVSQLRANGVLEAVLGNVGTIAAFRVGYEDAQLLEPVFQPSVRTPDLIDCPNWNGYMRIRSARNPIRPFSFETLRPNTTAPDAAWAAELRETSRRRWGVPAADIDAEIKARRRFIRGLADQYD